MILIKRAWRWLTEDASTQQFALIMSVAIVGGGALSFLAGYLIVLINY